MAPSQLPSRARIHVLGQGEGTTCGDFFCKKKLAVIFGTPGAFTPVCTNRHVPGFVEQAGKFKEMGVDSVACVTPNDRFVTAAWAKSMGAEGAIDFVSDGNLEWTKGLGLEDDMRDRLMGQRFRRFALVASNGQILFFSPEKTPNDLEASTADAVMQFLNEHMAHGG